MRNGQKPREKRQNGVVASSLDGRTWTWSTCHTVYRWCRLGHLEIIVGKNVRRVAFFRRLEAAVAYTCGYHDALRDTRSGSTLVN